MYLCWYCGSHGLSYGYASFAVLANPIVLTTFGSQFPFMTEIAKLFSFRHVLAFSRFRGLCFLFLLSQFPKFSHRRNHKCLTFVQSRGSIGRSCAVLRVWARFLGWGVHWNLSTLELELSAREARGCVLQEPVEQPILCFYDEQQYYCVATSDRAHNL